MYPEVRLSPNMLFKGKKDHCSSQKCSCKKGGGGGGGGVPSALLYVPFRFFIMVKPCHIRNILSTFHHNLITWWRGMSFCICKFVAHPVHFWRTLYIFGAPCTFLAHPVHFWRTWCREIFNDAMGRFCPIFHMLLLYIQ